MFATVQTLQRGFEQLTIFTKSDFYFCFSFFVDWLTEKEKEEDGVSLPRNFTKTLRVFPAHQSSCSSVMHLSYTGPCSSLRLGKMLSCCTIMLLTRALMRGCRVTAASSSLPHLTRLGPKQTARLYGCIMFSSLYWVTLRADTTCS